MYKSDADKAKEIRQELKEKGITSKQVSVTSKSAICVKVKDLSVSIQQVKEIAKKHEDISYCQASGEVLEGCNTFVFIDICRDAIRAARERYMEKAAEVYVEKDFNQGGKCIRLAEKEGERVLYCPHESVPYIQVWIEDGMIMDRKRYSAHDAADIAEAMAIISSQHGYTF